MIHLSPASPADVPQHAGDLYFVGYNVEAPPFCWYSGLDPDGHVLFDCPVPLSKGILMHDMQTTEDYAIILDTNLEFDPQVWLFWGCSLHGPWVEQADAGEHGAGILDTNLRSDPQVRLLGACGLHPPWVHGSDAGRGGRAVGRARTLIMRASMELMWSRFRV